MSYFTSPETSAPSTPNPYSLSNFSIQQYSNQSEIDATSSSYLEALESLELALVQHIKTAGLRKQREISLVDEVMAIRTERKKVFAALSKALLRQRTECTRLVAHIENERRGATSLIERHLKEIEELKTSLQHESQAAKELAHKEMEFLSLKSKYELKLKTLEDMVAKITEQKQSDFQKEVEHNARGLADKARRESEEVFQADIYKYKHALRRVAEREKDLEDEVLRLRNEVKTLTDERGASMGRTHEVEKFVEALKIKMKSDSERRDRAENQCLQLQELLEKSKTRYESHVQKIKEESRVSQAAELDAIDQKVRTAMERKDVKIRELTRELQSSEARRVDTENSIRDLNSGLVR